MYERHNICPTLNHKEKCFRVQQYKEGKVIEEFHEHIPSHRISLDSEIEVLKDLVSQHSGWNGLFILHSHLNDRRGGPSRYPTFASHTSYPEEGVLRRYFSSGNIIAWTDSVIVPNSFRREGNPESNN